MKYYVQIVQTATGKVICSIGPDDQRTADRIEVGASIKLNLDEYHTRQVEAEGEEQ